MDEQDEKSRLMPRDMPFGEVRRRAVPLIGSGGRAEESEVELPLFDEGPLEEGAIQVVPFQSVSIRKIFHKGEWFFSAVDVIEAVTGVDNPRGYWSDLKRQLSNDEGFTELYDKIVQLKLEAPDGKLRATDCVNVETVLRVIQSVRSKNAEPFKRWLAQVGYERIQEIHDPEISVKRAMLHWEAQGRTKEWIEARVRSLVIRKELTDEWCDRGIHGQQYGYLTGIVAQETFGLVPSAHSAFKGIGKANLRDHMTDLELILTMLGEKSTTAIAQATDAQGLIPNARAARSGGKVAGDARKTLENKLGRPVVSNSNFLKDGVSKEVIKKKPRRRK